MSEITTPGPLAADVAPRGAASARAFSVVALALAVTAMTLAGWFPLGFSLVPVFLFAGPHNWLEFRYFLARMPARWGPLRAFFLMAIGGACFLTAGFALMTAAAAAGMLQEGSWAVASALWNSTMVLWVAGLAHLRSREMRDGKQRDWSWIWPAACLVIALAWLFPSGWDLGLVYLHPLIALLFLQRVIRQRRPEWLKAYYGCIACLPLLLGVLWWRLANAPPLPGQDALSLRIAWHAGANLLRGVPPHLLIATHAFLEMLHYGVWIVAIPLLSFRSAPWRLDTVPLFRKGTGWSWGVRVFVLCGGIAVLVLWACFMADYPTTRDVYFTAAILHVLAEFPFLLRTL